MTSVHLHRQHAVASADNDGSAKQDGHDIPGHGDLRQRRQEGPSHSQPHQERISTPVHHGVFQPSPVNVPCSSQTGSLTGAETKQRDDLAAATPQGTLHQIREDGILSRQAQQVDL